MLTVDSDGKRRFGEHLKWVESDLASWRTIQPENNCDGNERRDVCMFKRL
jgi:hypothetical protein